MRTRKDDSQEDVDRQSDEEEDEEEVLNSLSFSLPPSSPAHVGPSMDQRKRFFNKL